MNCVVLDWLRSHHFIMVSHLVAQDNLVSLLVSLQTQAQNGQRQCSEVPCLEIYNPQIRSRYNGGAVCF